MAAQAEPRQIADDELYIERVFDAPVALVFKIWSEREHLFRWWGPEEFTATSMELEFRPGGKWRVGMVSDEYGEGWSSGVFREIVPNKRLVFTFAWEQGSSDEMQETLITLTFAERDDGKTLQTFHQTPFSSVESRDSHHGGWQSMFNEEEAYLAAHAG